MRAYRIFVVALSVALGAAGASAQLLDTTLTLGKQPDAVILPVTIATAGTYRITLTDLGSASGPPRLARVDAGLASGSTLVTSASVAVANATGSTTKTFSAATGQHRLILAGQPNAPSTVGLAGVKIDDPASGTVLLDTVRGFQVPPPPAISPATFEHDITIAAAGSYTLTVTDFVLPAALADLETTVVPTGASPINLKGTGQLVLNAAGPTVFQVFIYAELATNVKQGLVGVNLRDAGGTNLFPAAAGDIALHELGDWKYKLPFDAGTSSTLKLTLGDLGFPLPLASLGATVVTADGRPAVPTLVAPGTATSPALVGGPVVVYATANPAPGSTVGSFAVSVADGLGNKLLDTVQTVSPPPQTTDVGGIDKSFDVATAGDYTLTLTDFGATGFFDAFTSIDLALSRDDQIVKSLSAPGSFTFTAATPGHYSVAILADPAGTNGQGLLGVSVAGPAGNGSATIYEDTAAVGTGFISANFTVSTEQSVDVTLADLGFPANFGALKVAVTRGATRAGEITGEGKFSFDALPGQYFVNLLATPDSKVGYSTLGVNVAVTPGAPVVTLAASATSVQTGGSVMLTWTSTDANSCTASGGWTGARAMSGTESIGPLNANTTFALACAGRGGSNNASVSVTITGAQRSGGGGAFDWLTLGGLALLAAARGARRRP
jgi:hypothetical protein